MSHPAASTAVGPRQVEVRSASWTRIQLTLRLHPVDGERIDPSAVRLHGPYFVDGRPRRRAGDYALIEPARAWLEDDDLLVRINVMQGRSGRPLSTGSWRLVLAAGRDEPVTPIRVAPGTEAAPLADLDDAAVPVPVPSPASGVPGLVASFLLARGRYEVTPRLGPEDSAIALDVRIGAPAPVVPSPPPGDDDGDEPAPAPPGATVPTPPTPVRGRAYLTVTTPIRQLRPWVFHALFRLFRAVSPRNGRRILFTSDSRAELGGNLKIVHDRMVARGLDREYELLTLFKESITARRGFIDKLRLPWLLARADVIVLDDYHPVIYRLNGRDVRIVQLWHAWGAFKTVGYSRVGKPGGLSPWSRVHKNYTRAIVSSESEVPFYAEAFGIPESHVVPTGIPRMDGFWDPARAAASREAALAAYPAARHRFVILFAPTFRGHGARTATYDVSLLDYAALHALCVEKDAVCIIRMHPFVRTPLDIPDAYADRIIDGSSSSIDINDVLFATDLLVTDYSSVVFEFSTRDKPMLFFAYDLEEYVTSRDFYVDYRSFVPGRIAQTFPDLLDAIRRDDYEPERLKAFRARHLGQFDGQATDRVIDVILGR